MVLIDNGDGTTTLRALPSKAINRLKAQQMRDAVPDVMLLRALAFYQGSPDGQYDHDVVVPLLEAEIKARGLLSSSILADGVMT